jgi:3-hydroxyisobutyrate dehydrogenase
MMRIAILGTGLMGSAIAEAVLLAGHETIVYNRTLSKTTPLTALGARAVATPAAALDASDAAIVVAVDAPAVREMLLSNSTRPALRGRKILNLSTTTPNEIADLHRDVTANGGDLAEASVTVYPQDVRAQKAHFILGCEEADTALWTGLLGGIGSYVYRAGPIGAASTADMPLIATYILKVVTVAYAAALARTLDIPLEIIQHQLTQNPTLAISGAEDLFPQIVANDYSESMASIDTVASALQSTLNFTQGRGLNLQIFHEISRLFASATDRGLGGKDVAALFEALISNRSPVSASPGHPPLAD